MIKGRWRSRIWVAAPAVVLAAGLGLTGPARAQAHQPSRPAGIPGATNQSLQTLDKERPPPGSKRWVINDPIAYAQAIKTGKWLRTPYGLSYGTCVYRAPNNAVVDTNKIVSPSGSVQRITPCTHPFLINGKSGISATGASANRPTAGTIKPGSGPCFLGSGGVYWADSCFGTDPNWVGYMQQEYAVPSNPAKDGALIFLWGGLEDANGDTLLQDVLTWGANGNIVTNPNIWYVTNWYLWPGNNSVISPSMHVHPVDTIVAILNASNCDGAGDNCDWQLQSIDENTNATVTLNVTATVAFDLLFGAVMEVPRASGCVETPANGHGVFRQLEVIDGNGDALTPDFGTNTPDPQCSISINATSTSADILWKP